MRRALLVAMTAVLASAATAGVYVVTSDRTPRASPRLADTGWRGGVRLGVSVGVPGEPRSLAYELASAPDTIHVSVQAILDAPNCSPENSSGLPCPPRESARLTFGVSALVDGRTPLTLPASEVVLTGSAGRAELAADVPAPILAPGRHCVVVGVVERAAAVVASQLPHHAIVTAFDLNVAGSSTDHCDPPPLDGEPSTADMAPSCATPVISVVADRLEVRRSARPGTFTAALPACGRTLVFWVRDGRLLGVGDEPAPGRVPDSAEPRGLRRPQRLGSGEWVLAVLHRRPGSSHGGHSQPLVIA